MRLSRWHSTFFSTAHGSENGRIAVVSGVFQLLIPGRQRQANFQSGPSTCRPRLASSGSSRGRVRSASGPKTTGGALAHRSRLHLRIGLSRFNAICDPSKPKCGTSTIRCGNALTPPFLPRPKSIVPGHDFAASSILSGREFSLLPINRQSLFEDSHSNRLR